MPRKKLTNKTLGITQAEFGRREGVSRVRVHQWVKEGRIPLLGDGTIDPTLVGKVREQAAGVATDTDRRASALPTPPAPVVVREGETPAEVAERLAGGTADLFETKHEAEKVKETYLALLRKLEWDEKSGEVVKVTAVAAIVAQEYARVRSRLMSVPAAIAPRIAAMKTPNEVRDAIERAITSALEELAYSAAA